jgi:hypothetical protein
VAPRRRRALLGAPGELARARAAGPPSQDRPVQKDPAPAGALTAVAGGVYVATGSLVRVAGLPGARRRFTGSYDTGSFDPASMPHTVWLDDRTPHIDPDIWRLVVADADGERELSLGELAAFDVRVRAVLDCTGGWYAEQDWAGASLVRRYAAAKAMEDTDLIELSMADLFPEEEVDGVMFSALGEPGLRLEVALPFGFDGDPKATSERMAATAGEIQRLLAAGCADSGG